MCFLTRTKTIIVVFLFCCTFSFQQAFAIRIVAVVGDRAITDYDIENLGKMLCKIDKRVKCGSIENTQMSMMTMVETYLKLEHYNQSKIDLSNFVIDFEKNKEKIVGSFKIKKSEFPDQFND